jgi:hypothetical protein
VSLFRDRALRFALRVYLPLRVALSAVTGLVRALYPGDLQPDPVLRPYLGVAPVEGGLRGVLLGVWQRWDTLWYMLIARDGYSMQDTRIFAPPLYPWLMRLLGGALGGSEAAYLLGGLIVSNVACIALFVYLYRLVEREWNVVLAQRSVVYLAILPSAVFLFAAYSESLFLLCVVAAFYHARRSEWVWAGVWGFFAPLARLPGVVIVVPLAWEFARQWWLARGAECPVRWWRGWPLSLVVVGGLAFPLYAYWAVGSGSLLAPFTIHTQRFMGRFAWPWESLWMAVRVLASGRFRAIEPFDLFFALLFVALTVEAFRSLPLIYPIYMAVTLAGTLTKVSEVQPLLAVSRYVLVLFPGVVILARWGWQKAWVHRLILYLSAAMLTFFVGQFAIWGWIG